MNIKSIQKPINTSKVKIYAISGYGKLVSNMTAIVYDKSVILIDAGKGMQIPDKWNYLSIKNLAKLTPTTPNVKYLDKFVDNGYTIEALIITHPHGDHIGGIQEVYKYLQNKGYDKSSIPLYCSNFTNEFGKKSVPGWNSYNSNILEEDVEHIIEKDACKFYSFFLGHSSYHSSALYFTIKNKTILFLPDHKRDYDNYIGPNQVEIDKRLEKIFEEGVDTLILEATSVLAFKDKTLVNKNLPEGAVYSALRSKICAIAPSANNIFVSTYSTNPARIKAVIDAGVMVGKPVAIYGRGMWNGYCAAVNSGLFAPEECENVVKLEDSTALNKGGFIVLLTGHMGESQAKLNKLLRNIDPYEWSRSDKVILASTVIPKEGALYSRSCLINLILSKRIEYYTGEDTPGIHTSGHIGYHDFVYYVKSVKSCKKVIINHGDRKEQLQILAIADFYGVNPHLFHLMSDGQNIEV